MRKKRKIIISTALKEWGKSHFRETSLSSLAKSMGLTKPALYRYFRNKKELNQAIEDQVRDRYCGLGRSFLEGSAASDLEHSLRLYFDIHFRFFCEHPDTFYHFVLSALREPFLSHAKLKGIHSREIHRISKLLKGTQGPWGCDDAARILRYGFSTGTFWLHTFLHLHDRSSSPGASSSDSFDLREHRSLSKEQSKTLVADVSEAALYGLGGEGFRDALAFEPMENQCRVDPKEMPERNRIFESISEVVAEQGLGKASLEKIAQKAGMTKSSLYFYFRNKDDMLGTMLNRERDLLNTIFEKRLRRYKNIEEKIYSRFLVTASYHINNMTLLTAFTWFHYQGILANLRPPSRRTLEAGACFLDEAVASGKLRHLSLEPYQILFYINSLIFNEILGNARRNPPLPLKLKDMRSVFRYFSRGIIGSED